MGRTVNEEVQNFRLPSAVAACCWEKVRRRRAMARSRWMEKEIGGKKEIDGKKRIV